MRRQEVPEPEDEPEVPDVVEPAVEDEEESLLGDVVVLDPLEDDVSPEDFSDVPGASVALVPERESVR